MVSKLVKRWQGAVSEATARLLQDVGLLVLRLGAAGLMLTHGTGKLLGFPENFAAGKFADPIGVGPHLSLILAVFAEFFCSIAVGLGLATRLAAIPLAITMTVAAVIVHAQDPFGIKEKALLFLVFYVTLFLTGPGRFSLDAVLARRAAKADKA